MKTFLFKLSFFLVVPIVFVVLNVTQDPFHDVAPSPLEYNSVDLLLQQKKAPVRGNINLRQVRKLQLNQQVQGTDLAVFGGSTALEFGREQLPSVGVKNFAVPNHSIEDQLGLYYLYTNNPQATCKHFVMGLSPYFFLSDRSTQTRWTPLKEEYLAMLSTLSGPNPLKILDAELVQMRQLLSIDLARRSFTSLFNLREQKDVLEVKNPYIFPDGSWNKMSFSDSLAKVRQVTSPPFNPRFSLSSQVEEGTLSLLFALLNLSQEKHERVFVLLTPYAPSFYADLKDQNEEVVLIEQKLQKLCKEHGIVLVGSFNPENLQLRDADFMDPLHWHPRAMSAYFERIEFAQMMEPIPPR